MALRVSSPGMLIKTWGGGCPARARVWLGRSPSSRCLASLIHNEGRNNFAAHFALALHANFITVCNSLCNPQRKGIITKKKIIITKHIVFIYNLHFRIHYSWCQYFIMEEWDMLSFCLMEVNSDLILPRSWIFNRAEQFAAIAAPVCGSCRSFVPAQRRSHDQAEKWKEAALNFQWGDSTLSFSSVTIIGSVTQWSNMTHPR